MPDGYHALLSPSKSAMWIECPNALAAEHGQPEGDKKAADLGTDKHEIAALCLENSIDADTYLGHVCGKGHTVDAEFARQVQTAVDNVRDRIAELNAAGAAVTIEVEQDVPIGHITGEEGATGRSDVVLIAEFPDHLEGEVIDFKFGYREVLPDNNPQGMMYAAGAMEKFSLLGDFTRWTVVICQPAISDTPKEWTFSTELLDEWVLTVAEPAATKAQLIYRMKDERALKTSDFNPSEKTCEWCKAKAVCPAVKAKVEEALGKSFENIEAVASDSVCAETEMEAWAEMVNAEGLGRIWPLLDLVESWSKAVRGRIEHELLQGNAVPGCKLVEGRRGNRQWADDAEAEAMLKGMRLREHQMYKFQLLGPKSILEALKDQPRRLKKIEQLVVQANGKPHVAADTDPRPALVVTPPDEGFDELC